jgi:isoleucyl-tRNA synthetase
VPVILGEHVTTEAGTGAVHTAPGHGQDDYIVGQRYGCRGQPGGGDGCFLPGTPLWPASSCSRPTRPSPSCWRSAACCCTHEKYQHSYPHCWRHKTPIIFRATPQWFISLEQHGLRETALAAIRGCAGCPTWGQARIEGMVRNRPGLVHLAPADLGRAHRPVRHKRPASRTRAPELIEQVAQRGWSATASTPGSTWTRRTAGRRGRISTRRSPTSSMSGSTPASPMPRAGGGRPELSVPGRSLPGRLRPAPRLVPVLAADLGAMRGSAPYRGVLTHGFTVDAKGRKMSKSLGNVVAPQEVMNKLGADVLRLWVASTDYSGEMSVSDEILKRTADAYRRIRNTARFLLANLNGFDPARHGAPEDMLPFDRWAVDRARAGAGGDLPPYDATSSTASTRSITTSARWTWAASTWT